VANNSALARSQLWGDAAPTTARANAADSPLILRDDHAAIVVSTGDPPDVVSISDILIDKWT
jgi:hypothetical protein